jgi:hypothetical protein
MAIRYDAAKSLAGAAAQQYAFDQLKRRQFFTLVGGVAVLRAQQSAMQVIRIPKELRTCHVQRLIDTTNH